MINLAMNPRKRMEDVLAALAPPSSEIPAATAGRVPTPMPDLPPPPPPVASMAGANAGPSSYGEAIMQGIGEGFQRGIFNPNLGGGYALTGGGGRRRGYGGGGENPQMTAYELAEAAAQADKARAEDWALRTSVPFEIQKTTSETAENDASRFNSDATRRQTDTETEMLLRGIPTPDTRYRVDSTAGLTAAREATEGARRRRIEGLLPAEIAYKEAQIGAQQASAGASRARERSTLDMLQPNIAKAEAATRATDALARQRESEIGVPGAPSPKAAQFLYDKNQQEILALRSRIGAQNNSLTYQDRVLEPDANMLKEREVIIQRLEKLRADNERLKPIIFGQMPGAIPPPAPALPAPGPAAGAAAAKPKPPVFAPDVKDYPEALEVARAAGIPDNEIEGEAADLLRTIVEDVGDDPAAIKRALMGMIPQAGGQ